MKKYWKTISNEFQKQLNFRFFILAYVIGNFFDLLAQIVVWSAAFRDVSEVNGYDYQTMLSYVVFGWIFRYLTTNYEYESIIQKDIHLGRLSNFIIKPISYVKYVMANAIGRNFFAFGVIIVTSAVYVIIFGKNLIFSSSLWVGPILFIYFIMAYLTKFYISIIIGYIGFWTKEISGMSYSANTLVKFFSGAYFPLDLLPGSILYVFYGFPFIYIFFMPTQIFIGRIDFAQSFRGILVMGVWLLVLHFAVKILWKLGLNKYESAGI